MNNNQNLSVLYSWPVIVLALIIFWPVGVFLIIKRVTKDKKTALSGGSFISKASKFLYVIAALLLLNCFTGGMSAGNIMQVIFFAVAGYVLSKVAAKTKAKAEMTRQYLSIIVNGSVRSIDSIAGATGVTYDVAKKDIQAMIEEGYLKGAYIDESRREVVLSAPKPVEPVSYGSSQQAQAPTAKVISCPCCGANNTIYGSTGECEYCGSPIS